VDIFSFLYFSPAFSHSLINLYQTLSLKTGIMM
jgi:hypothetical protein